MFRSALSPDSLCKLQRTVTGTQTHKYKHSLAWTRMQEESEQTATRCDFEVHFQVGAEANCRSQCFGGSRLVTQSVRLSFSLFATVFLSSLLHKSVKMNSPKRNERCCSPLLLPLMLKCSRQPSANAGHTTTKCTSTICKEKRV